MGLFLVGLVHWFRFSIPVASAVSFFVGWTLASLIDRPKKVAHRAWIPVLASVALANYVGMRIIGW